MDELGGFLAKSRQALLLPQLVLELLIQHQELLLRAPAPALDLRLVHVARNDVFHLLRVERLLQIVIRAEADRFLGGLERAEPGEHDHGDGRIDFPDLAEPLDPRFDRHADIHHHRIRLALLEQLNAPVHGIGAKDVEAVLQENSKALPRTTLVVDHEHRLLPQMVGHDGSPRLERIPVGNAHQVR